MDELKLPLNAGYFWVKLHSKYAHKEYEPAYIANGKILIIGTTTEIPHDFVKSIGDPIIHTPHPIINRKIESNLYDGY
jgi:hypothetical protein